MTKFTFRAISLLACVSIMLAVIDPGIAVAHHREGHTKGNNGGDGRNDGRESFNAGVLMGEMLLFQAVEDFSLSSKSKPTLSDLELVVKKSKNVETRIYLKFSVVGITRRVISAKILLRSITNSGNGGELREVELGWPEDTIIWATRPFVNFSQSALSEVGRVVSDTYYEWDVLSVVSDDGDYYFAMTCDSCTSKYESRDASMIPYLVVVVDNSLSVAPGDPNDLVFAGAGDIANCGADPSSSGAEQTAKLLDDILAGDSDVSVFTAGDGAYPDGTLTQFQTCYDPTWGRHFEWTNPSPGNHEYITPGAAGYFTYFGARAGDLSEGYYSYNIGSWHFVALNSNCFQIGGCDVGSAQNKWLRADLAANSTSCIVAYLHHAPHSSGEHGSEGSTQPLMDALYDYGADILIAGHDHNYERFTPQDADGVPDLANGVRLFVVGSGGTSLRAFRTPIANSEARFNSLNGILKLTLHPWSYDWEFIPVAISNPEPVEVFSDVGSAWCH